MNNNTNEMHISVLKEEIKILRDDNAKLKDDYNSAYHATEVHLKTIESLIELLDEVRTK